MLDIAVLYGPGNSQLTGQLLQQLLEVQPKYAQVWGFQHQVSTSSKQQAVCVVTVLSSATTPAVLRLPGSSSRTNVTMIQHFQMQSCAGWVV